MLINKETTSAKDATVTLTGITAGSGTLLKLLATNNDYQTIEYSDDTNGHYGYITYDGQTFQGSTDGTLQGTATYPSVSPSSGKYVVSNPHSSMLVVKIPLS